MNVSAHRAFSLLKELAFERVSGSAAEERAANRLLEEARAAGADAHLEEFTVPCGEVKHAKLVVTTPYRKEYEVTGYERAESTPEGGVDLPFYYAETLLPVHLERVKGKAVLINGRLRRADYEKLRKAGAAAILTFSGSTIDRRSETDCDIRKLRETMTEPFGHAVALNMRAADAAEMVRRGAQQVHIELESVCCDRVSRNVCAMIEGTEKPEEIVSFGAHYDSVYFSTGVYDNMSGSVIIMELLRYFAAHRPARTVKFNWFGSEEQGLLGSKAWTAAHAEELDRHVLMINVDVAAATLGQNAAPVLATEAAVGYVDALMREAGFACQVKLDIYSLCRQGCARRQPVPLRRARGELHPRPPRQPEERLHRRKVPGHHPAAGTVPGPAGGELRVLPHCPGNQRRNPRPGGRIPVQKGSQEVRC